MPRLNLPSYRLHKPTGQAIVSLKGKIFYLGKWKSKASRDKYNELIAQYIGNDCKLPPTRSQSDTTVEALALKFLEWAEGYYVKNGRPTATVARVQSSLAPVVRYYGSNTCLGLAVDWRHRCPRLGNGFGGLSGPAIKPIALRCVRQIFKAVTIPVIGIGGIETIDDAMEFFVTGASAVQIGTANFYHPTAAVQILDALPAVLTELGVRTVAEIVGTLE
jgi:hypothetical protein